MATARNRSPRVQRAPAGGLPRIGRPPAVVVVDDHDGLRDAIRDMLQHDGWAVHPFGAVEDALRYLRSRRPDAILTDINAGSLTGVRLASAIRRDPEAAAVPVIAMSGCVDPPPEMRGLFDCFLAKPIDLPELDAVLRRTIARRRRS